MATNFLSDIDVDGSLDVSGILDITNTTDATDSSGDTGALKVEGGGSFAKHLYAHGFVSQMGRAELDHESVRLQPLGPYTTGKEVFSINPTWSEQQLQDYFDHSGVTWATEDDAPSGYSILITGNVGVGWPYSSGFPMIPIDDTSIYFTECWIKNVGTDQTHYMGSAEKKADFGDPASGKGNPGTYGYHVMSNTNPGSSWTRVTGYITGRSATTSGNFETDANYFSPLALFNYGAGTGTRACIISGWRIIKIDKQEYFADGTAALPSITNYNDADTGMYWNAANELSLTTGGTNRLTINSTKALFAAEVEASSLDINGNADISGNLSGVDTLTATTLNVTNYGLTSGDIPTLNQNTTGTAAQATNLNATDDRDMAPADYGYTDDLRIFFSSKEGLEDGTSTGSNWQDVLYLNSYNDSSGGDANILAFDKGGYAIYHYQADQAATNWGTAKQLAYTDSNITGNADTATALTSGNKVIDGDLDVDGSFKANTFASIQGVDTGNPAALVEELRVSGYGIMGNRSSMYLTNNHATGKIFFGVGGIHGAGTKMTVTSGGKVGIGEIAPSQELHVVGNARVTGAFFDSTNSAGTSGQVLSSTVTGTDWVDAASGSGDVTLAGDNTFTGDNTFDEQVTVEDLHVSVAGQASLDLIDTGGQTYKFFARNSDDVFGIYDGTNTQTFFRYTGNATNASTKLALLEAGGKIGIGTTTPTKTLDVSGDINLTGNILPGITDIKILPRDFIADDAGRPVAIDDVTTGKRHIESHSNYPIYASVEIPMGFKATSVLIYGNGTSAVTVNKADINSSTITSVGSGSIGSPITLTHTLATTTNYLLIELAQTSGEKVYGGLVAILKN